MISQREYFHDLEKFINSDKTDTKELYLSSKKKNISDEGYQEFDKCFAQLPNLFSLYCYIIDKEKLLKSRDIIECKNINVLTLSLASDKKVSFQHKVKALKIKRLVKFSVRHDDVSDAYGDFD